MGEIIQLRGTLCVCQQIMLGVSSEKLDAKDSVFGNTLLV